MEGKPRRSRLLLGIGLAFGILGSLFLLFNRIVDTQLRPLVEKELAKSLHSSVNIGSVRGGLTGDVILNHVSMYLDGSPWNTRLLVDQVSVNLDLVNLLFRKKDLESCLRSLSFIRPQVFLIHSDTKSPASGSPQSISAPVPFPMLMVPAPRVNVRLGSFFIQSGKSSQCLLEAVDFDALSQNGKSWSLNLTAHSQASAHPGILRYNGSLHLDDFKVSGRANLEDWPLASAGMVLKDLAGWQLTAGTLDAEIPLVFRLSRGMWYDAKMSVHDATVAAPGPMGVVFSRINGKALIRPSGINIPEELKFFTGEIPWRAKGTIPFDNSPLAFTTLTDHLLLSSFFTDILKIKVIKSDGEGKALLEAAGTFQKPVLTGKAELGLSHVGNIQLDSLDVQGGYQDGEFKIQDLNGTLYGGRFNGGGVIGLTGKPDAPISLTASLIGLNASDLPEGSSIKNLSGDGQIVVGGTLQDPVFSSTSSIVLNRLLRNNLFRYDIQSKAQLKDGKLELVTTINGKTKMAFKFTENTDSWRIDKLELFLGKKTGHLSWSGELPKDEDKVIDLQIHGKDISVQDIPFFKEQFPDVAGHVNWDVLISGTRKEPKAQMLFSSEKVAMGEESQPLNGDLAWESGKLEFNHLEWGSVFSVKGRIGLKDESPLDLRIKAVGIPIDAIAYLVNWTTPPQPFKGSITGNFHLGGIRKNPILDGEGTVTSFQAGDWWADRIDALLAPVPGKIQIRKLNISQGKNRFMATGSWDIQSEPGTMDLKMQAKKFQLGHGPFLSGDFTWNAQTGDPFWKNWNGTFTAKDYSIGDLKKPYQFRDFSMAASSEDLQLKGRVHMGNAVAGSAYLDLSGKQVQIQADLKIEPTLLSEMPELTQFLPPSLKTSGTVAGKVSLKGALSDLPLTGNILITEGVAQKYAFNKLVLRFSGDKTLISLELSLEKDKAKYALSGTLASQKAIWDPDCKIDLNGPCRDEKFANILSLLDLNSDKHKVAGDVNGNLSVTGTWAKLLAGFSLEGENLVYDNYQVPSAKLHFTESGGKFFLEKNKITLARGEINIEDGKLTPDPDDPSLILLSLDGSASNVPIAVFNLSSRVHLDGKLALEEKEDRPTFQGNISVLGPVTGTKTPNPFVLSLRVHHKIIDFLPLGEEKPQLVGQLDISKNDLIEFKDIQLLHSPGTFSVDGTLDLKGESHLTSDAGNIPIEDVGKWLFPGFPLTGTGHYHLILEGTLADPVFTGSLSVSNGKAGDLPFDLLDGEVQAKENMLFIGSKESPIQLTRKGLYSFQVEGKMPLALNHESWLKVRNQEMDINAQMAQGDFSLILAAGLAKKASGLMDFSAHVGGTLDDPILNMDLDLKQCQMVPTLVAKSIEDINGRIKVRDNKLVVEDLNGRIGQGRVFITSPPAEQTKMRLVNFIPQYLDFRVKTVGDHGLFLNIPDIMRKGEWGEIFFYGSSTEDPLLIQGPLSEVHVVGTALLDTGHYTWPPVETVDEKGEKIEYKELANVVFDLTLVSGSGTYYSNDFNSQYLEVKVDPNVKLKIEGKDSDKTPQQSGILCYGTATASQGYLSYLSHRFNVESVWLDIPKGKLPYMRGRGVDKLLNVDVTTNGFTRQTDMDVWVDFKGTFGKVDFTLDSNPHFSTNDKDVQQKILLSYILFGRDMTGLGYNSQQLQQDYQQKYGQAVNAALIDAFNRIATNELTRISRSLTQDVFGVDVVIKGNPIPGGTGAAALTPVPGLGSSAGKTIVGDTQSVGTVELIKPLNKKLTLKTDFGIGRDVNTGIAVPEGRLSVDYAINPKLIVTGGVGTNQNGQQETSVLLGYKTDLPDIIMPKKGDKEKPHFEKFEAYPIGPGKFHLEWITDKVTKSEIRVLDSDKQLIRLVIPENNSWDYRHEAVIGNLSPDQDYTIRITVKDPNLNEQIKEDKISATSEE